MEKEEIEELKALIPSECVRNYVLETGWTFTDLQKAVLLVNGNLTLKEQHSCLQTLQENTSDQDLRKRIAKYLNKEELKFRAFEENKDKAYIYILIVKEEDIPYSSILPMEYFFELNPAYECGRETNLPFMVKKYLVEAPGVTGQYDPESTFLEFNKDGEAVYFHGSLWGDDEGSEDFCDFFEIPNPFEQGDIVKRIEGDDYGIVVTSQKEWKKSLERDKNLEGQYPEAGMGYVGITITVEFLNDDGTFSHAHVNPLRLERYQPTEDRTNGSPMDKLLMCAALLYQGEGSLDELYFRTMDYRESQSVD